MNRKYRLTKTKQIKRVRHFGTSIAHPLVVLIRHPNETMISRFGVIAGKSIGNAVQRNRCKRLIREILRHNISLVEPGWDIIFLVRKPCTSAHYNEVYAAVQQLINHSGLITKLDAKPKPF